MPYVAPADALNLPQVDVDELVRRHGPPPWRIPVIATDIARWVLIEWPYGFTSVPHHHPYAEEVFYIVRGQADFTFEGENAPRLARPGMLLLAPRGVLHTIAVRGSEPLLLLCSLAPNEDRPDETVEQPV
jgi:mannose-6-phosphate isomerase-like protein (cupin superfamily)